MYVCVARSASCVCVCQSYASLLVVQWVVLSVAGRDQVGVASRAVQLGRRASGALPMKVWAVADSLDWPILYANQARPEWSALPLAPSSPSAAQRAVPKRNPQTAREGGDSARALRSERRRADRVDSFAGMLMGIDAEGRVQGVGCQIHLDDGP